MPMPIEAYPHIHLSLILLLVKKKLSLFSFFGKILRKFKESILETSNFFNDKKLKLQMIIINLNKF